MPMGASLADDARIDEQLANPQGNVYIIREGGGESVGTLMPVELENPSLPSCKFSIVIRKYK